MMELLKAWTKSSNKSNRDQQQSELTQMKIKPRYALQNIYLPSLRYEFCLGAE